nr:MAG TPA: hypothetical protein [Bacteriophage sp.]DAO05750.1 MAG TPA: hypothetical protein [Bacteriophage sp.]
MAPCFCVSRFDVAKYNFALRQSKVFLYINIKIIDF